MNQLAQVGTSSALQTEFDYIAGTPSSRPVFDFHTGARTTLVCQPTRMPIINARALSDPPQIEREGFTLVNHKTSISLDDETAQINRVYHDEVGPMLRDKFGAYLVIPFRIGMLIRRPANNRRYTEEMKGTRIAHLDYTPKSMDQWLPVVTQLEQVDPGKYSRMAVYQVWRMMAPAPQVETLALCDARTVSPDDGVVFNSVISDDDRQTFESRVMKPNSKYRWIYWNDLRSDELIIFKGFDTDPNRVSDVPHQAITNPLAGPTANRRQSIETRFFLFFK